MITNVNVLVATVGKLVITVFLIPMFPHDGHSPSDDELDHDAVRNHDSHHFLQKSVFDPEPEDALMRPGPS